MSVIIKVDTGFVGGIHEVDTGLSADEWRDLSDESKREWLDQAVWENIDVYAEDEDDEDAEL